ncbi:hypothetical protein [Deinococcus sp.]|uniref:hypothetical protein n=1 Tax=Deinococcus sp. TaxID=47478 RepID=UPI003CC52164
MHNTDQQLADGETRDQTQPDEFRVRITPGRADIPWRAVVFCPDEAKPLPFDHPETFMAYLRRRWLPGGLR